MKLNIYQIDLDKDENGVAFESYDSMQKAQNSAEVNPEIYDKIYSGEIEATDIEAVYRIFNIDKPDDFGGRSLSVSDVVEIVESEEVKPGFYYCDSIGFKEIDFDPSMTTEKPSSTIKVVMLEPGKEAYVTDVGTRLEDLQKTVDGFIEAYYPFEEEVCIVCNEEGKINGSAPCRGIYGDDGQLMDIVFGKFFICDCSGENFGSLSKEQLEKYTEQYRYPERMVRVNNEIHAIKYDPSERKEEVRA